MLLSKRALIKKVIGLGTTASSFYKPIFIISPPRSGSTFLYECLVQFEELRHVGREAVDSWWQVFPYDRLDNPSDYVGVKEASKNNLRKIRRELYQESIIYDLKTCPSRVSLTYLLGKKPIRYIDKTISNCFHLKVLDRAFVEAEYIFLVRDPRDTVSSMIEGWNFYGFRTHGLTRIVSNLGSPTIQYWTYPAPPGWQQIAHKSLPEICAWSWQQHVKYILESYNSSRKTHFFLRFEELKSAPIQTVNGLANRLGLKMSSRIEQYLKNPPLSSTTISHPKESKWKMRSNELRSVWSKIQDTAKTLGYDWPLRI